MAIKRIPPKRTQPLVDEQGRPTLRMAKFLEGTPGYLSEIADIGDLSTPTADTILLKDKLNEILTELRAAEIMKDD